MKRTAQISEILRPLSQVPTQAYISNALQVADILEWFLSSHREPRLSPAPDLKPPTVYQTTFSISEEFLRRTYFIRKKFPARLIVIIDRKALQKTISLWKFISKVYDQVWIADNHSKILLVDFNDGSHASMVTSQNLTRGNRAESAVISSSDEIYFPLLESFNDLRKNHSAPMHELMPNASTLPTQASSLKPDVSRLDIIERLAGYFVPISDIAVSLDMSPSMLRELVADQSSPESIAYNRGKTKARINIRAQEMELACIGSPLGMQSVRDNLLQMESDE